MSKRCASIHRKTNETEISLTLDLDGQAKGNIATGIGFFDHMLNLFKQHGLFNLDIAVTGDLYVDGHHSVEDIGICLGQAFRKCVGDSHGLVRFASVLTPMDDSLTQLAIDVSNRAYLNFKADLPKSKIGDFDIELTEEFFHAFVNHARLNLHLHILYGHNLHHMIESSFKAFGQCLDQATQIDPRKTGIPSTKGVL